MAEIWSYIAEEASEATANGFLTKLYDTCQKLLPFPHAHPERPQLAPGLRVTFHGAYAIYYQSDDAAVVVIRVLHESRDVAAIAEQGGFGE